MDNNDIDDREAKKTRKRPWAPRPPDSLWSSEEIAAYIYASYEQVVRLAQKGDLPVFKIGARWKGRPEDIKAWAIEQAKKRQEACRSIGKKDGRGGRKTDGARMQGHTSEGASSAVPASSIAEIEDGGKADTILVPNDNKETQ